MHYEQNKEDMSAGDKAVNEFDDWSARTVSDNYKISIYCFLKLNTILLFINDGYKNETGLWMAVQVYT